jgi:N-acetylneuraminic acid mutarotase
MCRHRVAGLSVLVLSLFLACSGDGTGPSSPKWTTRAPLPLPRTDHRVVVLGGKLYVLGGYSGSTLARVDEYDPVTDAWTRKADMATARRNFAAGVINGKIYVSAGMSFTDPNGVTYLTTTEEYDPVANTWTTRAPCPLDPATNNVLGNVSITGGAANGHLYVMVFNTNISGFTKTHEYDPGTDTWTTKAPPPFSYADYTMGTLGPNTLYLLASAAGSSQFAQYDGVNDTWLIRTGFPGRWAGLGEANGKLYAAGGVATNSQGEPSGLLASVREFDPTANQWIDVAGLSSRRHSVAVAGLNGKLYVIGGSSALNYYAPVPEATVEEGSFPPP